MVNLVERKQILSWASVWFWIKYNSWSSSLLFPLRTPLPTSHRPKEVFSWDCLSAKNWAHMEMFIPQGQSFSTQALLTFGARWCFVAWGSSMNYRMFSGITCHYPWDASSTLSPVVTSQTVSRHCLMSPWVNCLRPTVLGGCIPSS